MTSVFRASRALLLPKGRFSSLLDMGGVASAETKNTSLNVGKNNKVQAIALDFDLITRAIDKQRKEEVETGVRDQKSSSSSSSMQQQEMKSIGPNRGMVEDIANLLNIKLGGGDSNSENKMTKKKDDDLSRLTGMSSSDGGDNASNGTQSDQKAPQNFNPASTDIRSKYASKLRSKVEGGLAGLELAKSMKEEALSQGDAAAGHLIARSIAASNVVSKSGSKWMASTGSGTLCSFLSNRSMKIALLPQPGCSIEEYSRTKEAMEQLAKQLPNVKFSSLGMDEDSGEINEAGEILRYTINKISAEPITTVVVSDRDDILRSAKEMEMYTCRVRKRNEPRGNITTSYTVEDVKDVEDVINELNGISYNAVFNQ